MKTIFDERYSMSATFDEKYYMKIFFYENYIRRNVPFDENNPARCDIYWDYFVLFLTPHTNVYLSSTGHIKKEINSNYC